LRLLAGVALLAAAALAQDARPVPEILADHARALGDASKVRTLRSVSTLREDATATRLETAWRLPGAWMRRGGGRTDLLAGGAVFFAAERFRPNQLTTRSGYYLARALADPFPLLRYFPDGPGLAVAFAEGHEVLVGPRDENGVRALYLLDAKTHVLAGVRFEEIEGEQFVNVSFDGHRPVDGVVLPHGVYASFRYHAESPASTKLEVKESRWSEQVSSWQVNPAVDEGALRPAAPAPAAGGGFERLLLATGPDPHEIGAADLDGAGRTDVAVACEGALCVHFGGAGGPPVRVPLGRGHQRGLAVDDLDCDGRAEVVTTSSADPGGWYFVVSFDAARAPRVTSVFGAPLVAPAVRTPDLDRDGIPDLVACGLGSPTIEIKFGNGLRGVRWAGIRWPLATKEHPQRRGCDLDVADLDGDGLADFALADGERVVLFMGNVRLGFEANHELPFPKAVGVRLADLDGDGRKDVLALCPGSGVAVALNRDKLEPRPIVDAGLHARCDLATGDFDGDGRIDAAVTSYEAGQVRILLGDGKGGFGAPEAYASGLGAYRLCVADVDGDGRDDVLASNRLDDTVAVFRNRRAFEPVPRPAPPPRAVAVPLGMESDFRLQGLSDPYAFAGEFRLPLWLPEPSGIAALGWNQLLIVSDEVSALFRATLDPEGKRLLVSPPVPLRGLEGEALDLEGAAFDHATGNLFLACEKDSTILRATVFGHVLRRVPTGVPAGDNDGIEAVALRRKRDGTPLLYAFKEREGKTLAPPRVHVFGLAEDPFALVPRGEPFRLPRAVIDQTGAVAFGDRMFVVSRMERALVELAFDGDGFSAEAKTASFRELVVDHLGLQYGKPPFYGMEEGVTAAPTGDLFVVVDNNMQVVGLEGKNRGPEGRVLWFRNLGGPSRKVRPQRVVVRQLLVPRDARGAAALAADYLRRARAGEDFESLLAEMERPDPPLDATLRIVEHPVQPLPGEVRAEALPRALARLAFALEPGEIELCEHDPSEAPHGWHVVQRIE
jgi:hypothetical protein